MVHIVEVPRQHRKCPVCDSESFESIYQHQVTKPIGNEHWHFEIQEGICKYCGTVYTNPCPTNESLENYYRSKPLFVDSDDPDYDVDARINYIKRHSYAGAHVLEIGASDGYFIAQLNSLGFKTASIEPNESADYTEGRDLVSFGQNSEGKTFDLVLLNHVLEHIFDPLVFLKTIRKFVKSNGSLIIEVPNMHLYGIYSTGISHEHVTHFTPHGLKALLERSGYSTLEVEHTLVSRKEGFIIRSQRAKSIQKDLNVKFASISGQYFINRSYYIAGKNLHSRRNSLASLHISKLLYQLESRTLVLWGANDIALNICNNLSVDELKSIRVVDSNEARWGGRFCQKYLIKVESPSILKIESGSWLVCVAAIDWYNEIKEIAKGYGIQEEVITKIPLA